MNPWNPPHYSHSAKKRQANPQQRLQLDIRHRITEHLRHMVSKNPERGSRNATTIAIASSKGGVGKTTTAVNLATAMAELGCHVLLIDLDPQAHVAAALGSPPAPSPTFSDVMLGHLNDVQEVVRLSPTPQLMLAGSDKRLAETEMVLSAKIGKEFILRGALDVARTHHDIILIDCPPNIGTLTLNALCAAEHVIIPADMSVLALEGVSDMLDTVTTLRKRLGQSLNVLGILATRVDVRTKRINESISQSFRDMFAEALFATQIPQNASLNRAHMQGQSVFQYAITSPGAIAYRALAHEVMLKLNANIPKEAVG